MEAHKGKIKIDYMSGLIELEGDQDFIREIYYDFSGKISECNLISTDNIIKKTLNNEFVDYDDEVEIGNLEEKQTKNIESSQMTELATKTSSVKENRPNRKKSSKSRQKQAYQLVDIDLSGNDKPESLRKFLEKNKITSEHQRVSFIIYYLTDTLGLPDITYNHLYTAYHYLDMKIPDVKVAVKNNKRRLKHIDEENGILILNRIGQNHVRFPKSDV